MKKNNPFRTIGYDIPASVVVALVALPLCLGIALASGATAFSGLIAGVVGGIVVGLISNSQISVSGPAAGLTVIVLNGIQELGSFQTFLVALIISGAFQVVLGILKAGTIGNFFPSNVIKGMLAAIGVILILKQIPHAVGYDVDIEGDESFEQQDGHNTFSEMFFMVDNLSPEIILISVFSLAILLFFESKFIKASIFKAIPSSLIVVLAGILLSYIFKTFFPAWALQKEHLVSLPQIGSLQDLRSQFSFPDFTQIGNSHVWKVALTLTIVGSLESLLSLEAAEKLDPFKRSPSQNQELVAQGCGNMVSGFLGGLPVTAVIVRTSANVAAGGISKLSAILHGVIILFSVLFIPNVLNLIPLSSLAVILIMVGYKLTKPSLIISMYKLGWNQFIPFMVTIIAIVLTDMLRGISLGIIVSIYYILKTNIRTAILVTSDGNNYLIKFVKDVTFTNKSNLKTQLYKIPSGANLVVDCSRHVFIDHDIIDLLDEFTIAAAKKGINLEIRRQKEI
jgi:MFS superfamily sulfate permease-like transporter